MKNIDKKNTIILILGIVTFILFFLCVKLFLDNYGVRNPITRSLIYHKDVQVVKPSIKPSPKPSQKPTTLLPKTFKDVHGTAHAEAPVSKDSLPGNTGQGLKSLVLSYFPKSEQQAVDNIVQKESTWNPTAQNPTSGAYGLFQILPFSKSACTTDNIGCQTLWFQAYVNQRYGGVIQAEKFWRANGYY